MRQNISEPQPIVETHTFQMPQVYVIQITVEGLAAQMSAVCYPRRQVDDIARQLRRAHGSGVVMLSQTYQRGVNVLLH